MEKDHLHHLVAFTLALFLILLLADGIGEIRGMIQGTKSLKLRTKDMRVLYTGDRNILADFASPLVPTEKKEKDLLQTRVVLISLQAGTKMVFVEKSELGAAESSSRSMMYGVVDWGFSSGEKKTRRAGSEKLATYQFEAYALPADIPISYLERKGEPRVEFEIYDNWFTKTFGLLGMEILFTHRVVFKANPVDLALIKKLHQ